MLENKKNSDLKFFYNNTLFKDIADHKKHTELKKLSTVADKSLNGSTISISSSQQDANNKRKPRTSLITDRNNLVSL